MSLYYDHQDEIDRFIAANTLEAHTERHGFAVGSQPSPQGLGIPRTIRLSNRAFP